ncbi:MAG: DedA family protein [Chitinophagaceae bacterium]|nr:DedA family protein [Oligoflexus sp.]
MFESLILQWGYVALGIGTLLEGETILIAAGAMAHRGLLSLPIVIIVATIGGFSGDLIWYLVGRKYGNPFIEKRPKLLKRVAVIQKLLDKYGVLFVFSFRFIYGIRTVAPVFLGVARYPIRKYLMLNAVGAIVWGISFAYIGWGLGLGFKEMLSRHPHIEEVLILAVVVTIILWLLEKVYSHFRSKSLLGTAPELDKVATIEK